MAIMSKYIRPDVLTRIARIKFEPRQLVEGTLAGAHKSPFHGFAIEFAGHRDYVPGDDVRHLDWKVYYRHRKYLIKQYEMDTNLVCHLMLDVSASMRYGQGDTQKLLYASRMAVTLANLIVEQSDRVSLTTFDEHVVNSLAPSTRAASAKLSGIPWKKFFTIIILKALSIPGKTSAHTVLSNPRFLMSR